MTSLFRTDPLRDFKFRVQIQPPAGSPLEALLGGPATEVNSIGNIGFAVVSGIAVQNEMVPYREGGMNTHPHKMVGMSDFTPVTFSRGVFSNQAQMWRWQTFMHSWMQGTGQGNIGGATGGSTGQASDYRCDIEVFVVDHPYTAANGYQINPAEPSNSLTLSNERLRFKLYNCWPGGFALSDLNAGASSIMVQQMTVHHEGFELTFVDAPGVTVGSIPSTL